MPLYTVCTTNPVVADHLERPLLRIGSIDDKLNEDSSRGSEFKSKIDKATEWGGLVLFDGKSECRDLSDIARN